MTSASSRPVRVALDAMGGDHAPEETVKGAVEAAQQGTPVLLVGDPQALQQQLAMHGAQKLPIQVVPSEGVILEGEHPVQALRQKPRASILVATGLVKAGKADAVVTMGSTGAAMAAGTVLLGLLEGIERPALGGPIVGTAPNTVLIDLGTNVDCRPAQLLNFAIIGAVFARSFLKVQDPRVALLSVGAEEGKGNRQVRETFELFKGSGLRFIGNIEGHEVPAGKADVVVCDGFVGNILMKFTEGLGSALSQRLLERLEGRLSSEEARSVAQEIYDWTNVVERVGGGPIFGVNGVVVVGHGRSRAPTVTRAIHTARLAVEVDLIASLQQELRRYQERGSRP
ncbi:MAG: phosphate acyltransferase PlsX [Chloroflexi bacterium]|nr:phosphate acyltransferase PlsX [Chloroflexota bacterium]